MKCGVFLELKKLLNYKGVRAALIIFACIVIVSFISMCQKRQDVKGDEHTSDIGDVFGGITLPSDLTIDDNFSFITGEVSTTTQTETTTESVLDESIFETVGFDAGEETTTKVNYNINKNEFKANIEKGFKYSVQGDKVVIDSYLSDETNIKVPAKLGGYSVAAIGNGAFSGIGSKSCQSINSVEIESGVERIESKAFSSCAKLEYIKIPDSVVFIGEFAFENCPNLSIKCTGGSYARKYAIENDIAYMD